MVLEIRLSKRYLGSLNQRRMKIMMNLVRKMILGSKMILGRKIFMIMQTNKMNNKEYWMIR